MNPDFDDFDDVPGQQNEEPRSRSLPRLVVGVAIVAFIALAWYAYRSGSDAVKPGEIEYVEAESEGYKEKPEEPGGEEFPHKDKTIYDAISPYAADDAPRVEKLLPEPEQPVKPKEVVESKADSWVNDTIRTTDKEREVEQATAKGKTAVEKAESLSKEIEKSIAATSDVPVAKPAPAQPKAEAPKAAPVTQEAKPASQPSAAAGAYKIQLGAYKSDAEAKQTAARIIAKNGDVLSGKPQSIQRAELANGTFFRLRFGGFATPEAAKSACTTLAARGQGCFYAGK